MEKNAPPKMSRLATWVLGIFVLLLLTVLVLFQSSNLWRNLSVETANDTLILYGLSSLNFVAFVVFGFIFLRSIIKLLRERRTLQLGSRIKTRLFLYFAATLLLPIIAMAGFSYLFMNRALERWFTQIPENVVRRSKNVQDKANADQSVRLTETANMLAGSHAGRDFTVEELKSIISLGNLTYAGIFTSDGDVTISAERELASGSRKEFEQIIQKIKTGGTTNPELADGKGYDAAIAELGDGKRLVIVSNIRLEETLGQMVESALIEFDDLKAKQVTVTQIGFLTLGLLTFLLIFASSWTAFYFARGLTLPLKALAEGADEIAQGNLSHRVDVMAEDELALLVATFNQMSAKLEENSVELNERKRYIETVLQSLPTGVVSFDAENRVSTINHAAISILNLEDADFTRLELEKLVSDENRLILERVISRAKRIGHASEQTVLKRESSESNGDSSAMPVVITATALAGQSGAVLVIEDLSELIAAQRASAWQEVARRMAHEIKNPLTPIQLSAERIAKRFASQRAEPPALTGGVGLAVESAKFTSGSSIKDESNAQVIVDGTDTILREVQSLKSMVDEFSRFARLPNAKLEPGDLNELIRQVLALYQDRHDDVSIDAELAAELPQAMIDPEQLKRVFVNLIDNAIEAFDETLTDKAIMVKTRHDLARDIIVAEVADSGKGIDPADFQRLFQPYFSTKGRGTGLGLPIVQRIVGEHGGKIKVVANQPRGAKFIIELQTAA
ncbi:MAG: ATP-binding protein [Blastocatellia bacterium]